MLTNPGYFPCCNDCLISRWPWFEETRIICGDIATLEVKHCKYVTKNVTEQKVNHKYTLG